MLGTDVTPRSEISTVSMTITIIDINDNPPVILNPAGSPVPLLEVYIISVPVIRTVRTYKIDYHFFFHRREPLALLYTHSMLLILTWVPTE